MFLFNQRYCCLHFLGTRVVYSAHLQSIAELLKAALLLEYDRQDETLLQAHHISKTGTLDTRTETLIRSDVFRVMTAWKPQIAVDSVSADRVKVVWASYPGCKDDEGKQTPIAENSASSHPLQLLLSASLGESLSNTNKDSDTHDLATTSTSTSTTASLTGDSSNAKRSDSVLHAWRVKDYSLLMTTDGTAVLRTPTLVSVLPATATSYSFESLDPEKSYRFRLRANLEPVDQKSGKATPSVKCDSDDVFIGSRVELALAFATDAVGPNLKLDGPLTVRNNTNKKWNTARASSGFHSGIHSWEVSNQLLRYVPGTRMRHCMRWCSIKKAALGFTYACAFPVHIKSQAHYIYTAQHDTGTC